jgi:hypothetical protein
MMRIAYMIFGESAAGAEAHAVFVGIMQELKFHPSDEDLSPGTPINPRLPPITQVPKREGPGAPILM